MTKNINSANRYFIEIFFLTVFSIAYYLPQSVFAAPIPNLVLTNHVSNVLISVSSANPNTTVNFNFPNYTNTSSGNTNYTSIDLGQTDSTGSYQVSVAPDSYGLSQGSSVYVSVGGIQSQKVVWPASSNLNNQSGTLSLSQTDISLVNGTSATVNPINTTNALTLQNNSNPNVAYAYLQQSSNSVLITGTNVGSTAISLCVSGYGCSTVNVSVTQPTLTITFSLPSVYIVRGQQTKIVKIYGPGSSYNISNSNKDILSATIDGTELSLQGIATGKATLSVCAPGWNCGVLSVTILPPGSSVPDQTSVVAPISSDLSKAPELTSVSISTSDALMPFFGANSLLNVNFGVNQTIQNVSVKIAGSTVNASQGTDGKYYLQYHMNGSEQLPIPISISFTNLGNIPNSFSVALGKNGVQSSTETSSGCPSGYVCIPQPSTVTSATAGNSGNIVFTKYLYMGMTSQGVSDPDIVALQNKLKSLGVYSGPVTGYFGPLTKAAVQTLQKKNGLDPIGVVGPSTRALLNK